MGPLAHSDGHDAPRLIDKLAPRVAAVVEDILAGSEYAVREPVVAHEPPYVLDRIEIRTPRRQRDVELHDQFGRSTPSGLIEQEDRIRPRRNVKGDLIGMHAHRLAVAAGRDNAGGLAFSGQIASKSHAEDRR